MSEQLPLVDIFIDQPKFEECLDRATAIENEMERLRGDLNSLREEYAPYMPVKAVFQALSIVRKRRKLARKGEDALTYSEQDHVEAKVQAYLDTQEQAMAELEDLTRGEPEA